MKTKVFVTGNTGIDAVPHLPGVASLPERIIFSEEEIYESYDSLDSAAFLTRIKYDSSAKPVITGCTKEKFFELVNNALSLAYDQFVFILTKERVNHYTPMIEEFMAAHEGLLVNTYVAKSSLYPAAYFAIDAEARMRAGEDFDDAQRGMHYFDEFNAVYLFSSKVDSAPTISRVDLEDAAYIARPKTTFYYIQSESPEQHRVKAGASIKPYLEDYCREIENKNVIPFVLYSNPRAQLPRAFEQLIQQLFPKMKKLKKYPLSPEAILKYGENTYAIGYLLNREVLE